MQDGLFLMGGEEYMIYFLGTIYPYACVLVPCIIWQVIMSRRSGRKVLAAHLIWTYIFLIYVSMAFSVAGIGSIWDLGRFGDLIRPDEINLVPFKDGFGIGHVLNVMMFMPLGFLVPLIWTRYRNIFRVAVTGAWLSLAIELGQLCNRRASDIDDLMMNTLGAVAGFGIWVAFDRIFIRKRNGKGQSGNDKKKSAMTMALSNHEPEIYLMLAVLTRFFLYDWMVLLKWL